MTEMANRVRHRINLRSTSPFDEKKTTQIAAFFLRNGGGALSYLSLVKLVYLADREALRAWNTPLTRDKYYSLPHGPIVSKTLDLITDDPELDPSYWNNFIGTPEGNNVSLKADPGTDALSRAELSLLKSIFDKYGHMNKWKLRDLTHGFQEYQDPHGGRISITYEDILVALGCEETEADVRASEIKDSNFIHSYFSS